MLVVINTKLSTMHFAIKIVHIFIEIEFNFVHDCECSTEENLSLLQLMAWCQVGYKPHHHLHK